MILLSQWYSPADETRRSELASARSANESSGEFDRVVYVDGTARTWGFADFFRLAASEYRGEVCVVANTDIVFCDTARIIPGECKPNRLVTLTRWGPPFECPSMLGRLVGHRFYSGTQDAWAFIGGELPDLEHEIPLGVVGCDQAVVGWATASWCEVTNPSMSILTMHVHADEARTVRQSMAGLYGYPEMTVAATNHQGIVFLHEWPQEGGIKDYKVVKTCRQ